MSPFFDSISPENTLILIDSSVENAHELIRSLSPEKQSVMLLNSQENAIQEITEVLANYQNLSSLHVISHGDAGEILLGNNKLSEDNLTQYQKDITQWGKSLSLDGDVLFYGCNVAKTEQGQSLLQQIAHLTETDIAGSTDLTGNASLGGDWEFEYQIGTIESSLPFDSSINNFQGTLNAGHDLVEHSNFLDLVPHSLATHVAIKSGNWFDSSIWSNGQVPDNDADVLISQGINVILTGENQARLDTLRVDGNLTFASNQNTQMIVDTFVVAPTGQLNIGTANNPIQEDKTAKIIFTSDGAIDKNWDPTLLSRGLISHGQARIFGADKADFLSLQGNARGGSNELVLSLPSDMNTPKGWRVGDQLVLGGTDYNRNGSDVDNSRYEDEVLTITAINGNRIRFTNNNITSGDNTVLRFDHERPEGFESQDLKLYVANTSRNVSFETENGGQVPTQERAHVMFMHNPDVQVHNAGFYHLGRTDKTKDIDDVGTNIDGSGGNGTNARGRYALHFHKTGLDINRSPALATGNAVVDSPGWGIVQHQSHAILEQNVVFDVAGAGIVAEGGNEIGAWRNNLTIKMTGDGQTLYVPSDDDRSRNFDFGYEGEGYWVQGAAQVAMVDNIAISNDGSGLSILNNRFSGPREVKTISVANLAPELQFLGNDGTTEVDIQNVPLRQLTGFQSYNSLAGIYFYGHLSNGDGQLGFEQKHSKTPTHELRAVVDDFQVWNIRERGVFTNYTTQLDLVNGLILGDVDNPSGWGISGNSDAINHHYKNLHIEGFRSGIKVPREGQSLALSVPYISSRIEDSYVASKSNNLSDTESQKASGFDYVFPDYFEIINTTFKTENSSNKAPTAKFNYEVVGGLAIHFDASQSYDTDEPDSSSYAGEEIASYGWDFDNDGVIDSFGRKTDHYFDAPGTHNVSLTVWDSFGATNKITKTLTVNSTAYINPIQNGDFSSSGDFIRSSNAFSGDGNLALYSSMSANYGWVASSDWKNSNGTAVLSSSDGKLGQVILDNQIRRGQQTLSVDIKNTEQDSNANEVVLRVWGVDGQFVWDESGPEQYSHLSMNSTKLLEQTVGGQSFDWKTFNWNLNFGDGYQFLFIQVDDDNVNPGKGDYVALDNFSITSSGGTSSTEDTTDPLASFNGNNITDSGDSSYSFEVTYTDDQGIALSSLDNNDLIVSGVNSFSRQATLVNTTSNNDGTSVVATYQINTPGGTWDFSDNGTYTVTLASDQVTDTSGNPVASGNLGNFSVDIQDPSTLAFQQNNDGLVIIEAEDFDDNTSRDGVHQWVVVNDSNASGGQSMEATPDNGALINTGYSNNSPQLDYTVNFNRTGTHYVWILGKAGGSDYTKGDSVHLGLDGQENQTSDRITGFENSYGWSKDTMDSVRATIDVTTTGLHTLNLWMREDGFFADQIVLTTDPNFAPSFTLSSTDTTDPLASFNGNNITDSGDSSYSFEVTYTDDQGIALSSLDNNDLIVSGVNSFSRQATLVNTTSNNDGTSVVATYQINTPGGTWDFSDNGTYTVTLASDQVTDTSGNPVASGNLGNFSVDIQDPSTLAFQQNNDGLVIIEAEDFDDNTSRDGVHQWVVVNDSNASGGQSMEATPDNGALINTGYSNNSPQLDYTVNFNRTGTHYVWILGKAGGSDYTKGDSVHLGLDGQENQTSDRITGFENSYGWSKDTMDSVRATIDVTTTGLHTLNLWMREDGFFADQIVLTTDPNFAPSFTLSSTDTTDPLASFNGNNITDSGDSSYSFEVTYTDDQGIALSSLDNNDLIVSGVNSFSRQATLVNTTSNNDGTSVVATYQINTPGGTWDFSDNGTYTVTLASDQVTDTSGNPVASGNLGNFSVDIQDPSTLAFQQNNDGLVIIEAEDFDDNTSRDGVHQWVVVNDSNASGGQSMEATPDNGALINTGYSNNSPQLDYTVNFNRTGTHYVWILGKAGGSDYTKGDSVHLGLDGQENQTSDRITGFENSYGWSKDTMDSVRATIDVTTTGLHTLNLWMREDGFFADQIVLTTDPNFDPLSL